jgi:hypothetical protein
MIFGFNTDVKYGDTVYHVQSEARQADLLLQSQVFVKGRCIGKKATSYAQHAASADFSEDQMHTLLKAQHKTVLDAIRAGAVEALFAAPSEVEDVDGSGLALSWTNSDTAVAGGDVVMRFRVTDTGSGVAGAKLTSRLSVGARALVYAQAVTDERGNAEITVSLENQDPADAAVLVQANHAGKTATRKFRLQKQK